MLRVSSDGRVLWRVNLSEPAVGLFTNPNGIVIAFASGKTQMIDANGSLGTSAQLNTALDSPPMQIGGRVLFHTPDNRLVSTDHWGSLIDWQIEGVAPILRWITNEVDVALMTADNTLLTFSLADDPHTPSRALLREPGSLALDSAKLDLLAYTKGGLWRINVTEEGHPWSLQVPDAPSGGRTSAVAQDDQQTFLFDGASLHAYGSAQTAQWSTPLPGVSGTVSLSIYNDGGVVLLTSTHGDIIAVQAASGGVCNTTRIYGSSRSREWHDLGSDGVLRVYIADQIIGLNWQKFLMACAQ